MRVAAATDVVYRSKQNYSAKPVYAKQRRTIESLRTSLPRRITSRRFWLSQEKTPDFFLALVAQSLYTPSRWACEEARNSCWRYLAPAGDAQSETAISGWDSDWGKLIGQF
jgi:hypothetical protein